MDPRTYAEISSLERRAAMREQLAEEREARAPVYYGGGSYNHIESMTRAEEYRTEARELRDRAERLRRKLG